MKFEEVNGDLITLALEGKFDVITHGCNCFCTMSAGIAVKMAKVFGCDEFPLEQKTKKKYYLYDDEENYEDVDSGNKGNINKLGQIDFKEKYIWLNHPATKGPYVMNHKSFDQKNVLDITVVNSYTQYHYGHRYGPPVDYEAITLCMRKINKNFAGKHIGLPLIGTGLAGGDWKIIKSIFQQELKNLDVTVVYFEKK